MAEDDAAVSPVIATILMVAITVVLSGVIYVWASSLAETDVKGVPRVTFDIEDVNGFDADEGPLIAFMEMMKKGILSH